MAMTIPMPRNSRPDIPDLPRKHYWAEGREPSVCSCHGQHYMSIRKRTLFGSKEITRVYMDDTDHHTKEAAMIRLGTVMGL